MATRRVDIRINVDDLDAGKRLDDIAAKLDKLSKGTWTIKLRLDDGGTIAKIDDLVAKLEKVGSNTYTPKLSVDGIAEADAELDKFNAKLDKVSHRRVTATVHTRTTGGRSLNSVDALLGDIFGGGGGGGGGGAGRVAGAAAGAGGSGGLTALFNGGGPGMAGLIASLIAYGMSVGSAIIPFGLGGLVGGGGALLAGKLGTTGLAAITADKQALARAQAALKGASGGTPANKLALKQAQQQLGLDQSKYGGFVPFGQAAHGLEKNLLGALLTGVSGTSPGFSAGPHGQPGGSFLSGLTPILAQIGTFLHSIGPGLGDLFRASLPSLAAFVKIGEQFAKAILPAMTQSLKALGPSLPILVQGFKYLSQGIAGFIIDLGPGMKDAAIIFKASMIVVKGILQLIGVSASALSITIVKLSEGVRLGAKEIPHYFDIMRHLTADEFDAMRHFIATTWDSIFQNTIGRVSRMVGDVMNWDARLRHSVSSDYDLLRHYIASEWDQIWQDTIGKVERGIAAVEGWFHGLPRSVQNLLGGLGKMLEGIATGSMNDFLSGLKAVGSSILGWIKHFFTSIPGWIMKQLHMSPPHPGSAFYDIGANFMHHLEAGMKSRASSLMGTTHSLVGGSAGAAQNIARSLLGRYGWGGQWGALNSVAMRESGWSMTARNPSSGAYGIAQFINGPSEYYQYGGNPGTAIGQVTAFMNYIRQRYGNPNAAWAHELNYGWYDQGGPLKKGLTLALNTTGHDEMIVNPRAPLGAMGMGGGGNVYITVQGDTDPDGAALRIVQKLRKYKTRHGGAALGLG